MNRIMTGEIALILLVLIFAGCDKRDQGKEVAKVAREAADRQAQQNTEMARVNREVAEGTRRLVEADSEARKEMITVHKDLQAERSELNEGFASLEAERKQIAGQRLTESMLVPAAKATGVALVVAVVVGFCWALLVGLRESDAADAELNEILIDDLAREQPRLVLGPSTTSIEEHNKSGPPLLHATEQDGREPTREGRNEGTMPHRHLTRR